ncbi:MAG: hypothetical protein HKL96_02890 [Phycisphaerales bacterium]|nr:hypothetical protein [Phycisphaerales bacterium]
MALAPSFMFQRRNALLCPGLRRAMVRVAALLVVCLFAAMAHAAAPFAIHVVDSQTHRGVPLVELQTTNGIRLYTDSAGTAAFNEPGLMHRTVYFYISSPDYLYAADGFGYRGQAIAIKPGGAITLLIMRTGIAQRMYRITGEGLYRDTLLTGGKAPIKQPLLNSGVFGSDSVQNCIYRGQLFWLWGDTLEPQYPLGNFATTCATSRLASKGALSPAVGINLHYFVNSAGLPRRMAPLSGPGPVWLSALSVLPDAQGQPQLLAIFAQEDARFHARQAGVMAFNAAVGRFMVVKRFAPQWPLLHGGGNGPGGHTFFYAPPDGRRQLYFADPLPLVRVPALATDFAIQGDYESFSCLKSGSTLARPRFDRTGDGRLMWRWRKDTAAPTPRQLSAWITQGLLAPRDNPFVLRDIVTDKPLVPQEASIHWNSYRKAWVMIFNPGISGFGDTYLAFADTPLGPWGYAVRVVHFTEQSFYNPSQDWFFDQHGGRNIYFEATLSSWLGSRKVKIPRYDYNQLMYRINLASHRTILPMPVYGPPVATAAELQTGLRLHTTRVARQVAFFAPQQRMADTQPVCTTGRNNLHLQFSLLGRGTIPLFYALPPQSQRPGTAILYAFKRSSGPPVYSLKAHLAGLPQAGHPLCRVWPAIYRHRLSWPIGPTAGAQAALEPAGH